MPESQRSSLGQSTNESQTGYAIKCEHNPDALEKGLNLLGRQYPTAVGPIDLLAKDTNGVYVVIELKKGQSGDKVVGQIARYLTWVMQRLAGGKDNRVRGVVVGKEFDKRFAAAIAQLKRVASYTFDVKVLFERWQAGG
jgi:RecB family endonuclease NucS